MLVVWVAVVEEDLNRFRAGLDKPRAVLALGLEQKPHAALESWGLKIERQLSDVRAVYAYVNNHFEGFALGSAQRLAERLGYELPLPSTEAAISAEDDRKQLDLEL